MGEATDAPDEDVGAEQLMADTDDDPPVLPDRQQLDDAQLRRLRIQRQMWHEKTGIPQQTHPMPPGYTVH